MANIGKNGYSYTGYTEPFIVPPGEAVLASVLSAQNFGITGIAAAVPIEYSEFRNAGLYVRAFATTNAVTFTSKDLNFDVRMDDSFTDKGKFIISDDGGITFETVDGISYDNVTELYTVTCSGAFNVTAGTAYRVLGRKLDVGNGNTTNPVAYTAGQRVVRPYEPSETV